MMTYSLDDLRMEAARVASEWGIPAPTVTINHRFHLLGGMYYLHDNRIELAAWLLQGGASPVEILGILRHELAHMVAMRLEQDGEDGHGPTWKEAAAVLGAVPKPCYGHRLWVLAWARMLGRYDGPIVAAVAAYAVLLVLAAHGEIRFDFDIRALVQAWRGLR